MAKKKTKRVKGWTKEDDYWAGVAGTWQQQQKMNKSEHHWVLSMVLAQSV